MLSRPAITPSQSYHESTPTQHSTPLGSATDTPTTLKSCLGSLAASGKSLLVNKPIGASPRRWLDSFEVGVSIPSFHDV